MLDKLIKNIKIFIASVSHLEKKITETVQNLLLRALDSKKCRIDYIFDGPRCSESIGIVIDVTKISQRNRFLSHLFLKINTNVPVTLYIIFPIPLLILLTYNKKIKKFNTTISTINMLNFICIAGHNSAKNS